MNHGGHDHDGRTAFREALAWLGLGLWAPWAAWCLVKAPLPLPASVGVPVGLALLVFAVGCLTAAGVRGVLRVGRVRTALAFALGCLVGPLASWLSRVPDAVQDGLVALATLAILLWGAVGLMVLLTLPVRAADLLWRRRGLTPPTERIDAWVLSHPARRAVVLATCLAAVVVVAPLVLWEIGQLFFPELRSTDSVRTWFQVLAGGCAVALVGPAALDLVRSVTAEEPSLKEP